jgi:site-specific recombinase XerD
MAAVGKDGANGWRIRFIDGQGIRKTVRLGKMSKPSAESICRHVAELASSKASGQPVARQTALWLPTIEKPLYQKLMRVGLVENQEFPPLDKFLTDHIERGRTSSRKAAAEGTKKKWRSAKAHIVKFFGADQDMRGITEVDVEKFRVWLEDQPVKDHTLAENTIRSVMACSKMFFNVALRQGFVLKNPFSGEASTTKENRKRDFYVKPDVARKIMDACPTTEWKLMIALWRFAGLRKTEIYHLRWSGVLWDAGKMKVSSPKTSHHAGCEERFVPIGDILPWLRAAFEQPGTGDRIITNYTETNCNLDKPLKKILTSAGIIAWPKLFQNMRASCETDWLDRGISAHVVANWIGHSVKIQVSHYAQVDAHHFEKFNAQSVAQNAAQQITEESSIGPPNGPQDAEKH